MQSKANAITMQNYDKHCNANQSTAIQSKSMQSKAMHSNGMQSKAQQCKAKQYKAKNRNMCQLSLSLSRTCF